MNSDGTKCDTIGSKAGANCSVGSTLAEPVCDVCKYGFQKADDGSCEAISNADCLIQDKDAKCLICNLNYSMDKDGKCSTNVTPEPPCTGDDCSTSILRFSFSLLLAFFLMRLF